MEKAKADIRPFIRDQAVLEAWSVDYFLHFMSQMKFEANK
jgi:hypothetical protein